MADFENALDEDELILSRYKDIEWADNIDEYRCARCGRVLIQHYISNCEHKHCLNCKGIVGDGSQRWRCKVCKEFITDIDRQDVGFRARVFMLRVKCPNTKYGCQHQCTLNELKGHLKRCENTKERALPVLYKGAFSLEMLEQFTKMTQTVATMSIAMEQMKQQLEEQKNLNFVKNEGKFEEQLKLENKLLNESVWELSLELKEMNNKMKNKEKEHGEEYTIVMERLTVVNEKVDGFGSDLHVETTRLNNDLTEIKKKQGNEGLSLAVEKNKLKILKLEGKSDLWLELLEKKDKNVQNELQNMKMQIQHEFEDKNKICQFELEKQIMDVNSKVEITNSDLHVQNEKINNVEQRIFVIENDMLEKKGENIQSELLNMKMQIEVKEIKIEKIEKKLERSETLLDYKLNEQILRVNEKMEEDVSGLNKKLKIIEDEIEIVKSEISNNLSETNSEQNICHSKNVIYNNIPQLTLFNIFYQNSSFRPNLTWKINGINDMLKQKTFEIKSEVFEWTGYPVKSRAKLEIKDDDDEVYLSLCLERHNEAQHLDIKSIPKVYYLLRDQSKNSDPKHKTNYNSYLFTTKFYYALKYERSIGIKSDLTDVKYNVDDSIVIEMYVEGTSMTQQVHSYDGTLNCAIDNYLMRKDLQQRKIVWCYESPYFYTEPRGYRVQVRMFLNGNREYEEKGLWAYISFLTGEYDGALSEDFPHQTTITLLNRKDPEHNITKTVDKDNLNEPYYLIHVCNFEEIGNIIENDTLFYKVSITRRNP